MQARESCIKKAGRWLLMFGLLLVPLAVIPVLSGWVGDIVRDMINGNAIGGWDYHLLWMGFALLLLLAGLIVWKGRKLLPVQIIEQTPSFEQRRVVVAMLSPCGLKQADDGSWVVQGKEPCKFQNMSLEEIVRKDCILPGLNWQQTLRAAYHHRTRLEKLVLVGSRGGSGTTAQLESARQFFSVYFPGKVVIYGSPSQTGGDYDTRWQTDFEDLAGLSNLLRNILRELHRDTAHYTDRDIIIDCTSGPKTASIAAALVTLHRPDLMFQYVGTGDHTGQVTGFNVATESYQS